jgi:hypothetical protein
VPSGGLPDRPEPDRPRQASYARALRLADDDDDQLLVSYVVRHQGFHLLGSDHQQAIVRLRRSLSSA